MYFRRFINIWNSRTCHIFWTEMHPNLLQNYLWSFWKMRSNAFILSFQVVKWKTLTKCHVTLNRNSSRVVSASAFSEYIREGECLSKYVLNEKLHSKTQPFSKFPWKHLRKRSFSCYISSFILENSSWTFFV